MIFWLQVVVAATFAFFAANLLSNFLFSNYLWSKAQRSTDSVSLPSISILVPARNEEVNLVRLIPSILNQSYSSFELVVYDDRSSDNTKSVVESFTDDRIKLINGAPLPNGWFGKNHALYQCAVSAENDLLLFLDADMEFQEKDSLLKLVKMKVSLPERAAFSGLPRLRDGGIILVSIVHFVIMTGAPWLLSVLLPFKSMTVLNGQFWMISRSDYEEHQPHEKVKDKILEDVEIGRYLKKNGIPTYFALLRDHLSVYMYRDLKDAIHGLSKNAYLIAGGSPLLFIALWVFFSFCVVFSPILSLWFLLTIFLLKMLTDLAGRLPFWVSLLAPVTMIGASLLQLYSALLHWTGRVTWKNRPVK